LEEGADVRVGIPREAKILKPCTPHQVTYCDTIEQAVEGADLCMILTDMEAGVGDFDLTRLARLMKKADCT
jgi:UDPglucose 6-dehydrogenase